MILFTTGAALLLKNKVVANKLLPAVTTLVMIAVDSFASYQRHTAGVLS